MRCGKKVDCVKAFCQRLVRCTLPCDHVSLLDNQTSHTMPYEHYSRVCIAQIWGCAHFAQQRLAEVMNVQATIFALDPV